MLGSDIIIAVRQNVADETSNFEGELAVLRDQLVVLKEKDRMHLEEIKR